MARIKIAIGLLIFINLLYACQPSLEGIDTWSPDKSGLPLIKFSESSDPKLRFVGPVVGEVKLDQLPVGRYTVNELFCTGLNVALEGCDGNLIQTAELILSAKDRVVRQNGSRYLETSDGFPFIDQLSFFIADCCFTNLKLIRRDNPTTF